MALTVVHLLYVHYETTILTIIAMLYINTKFKDSIKNKIELFHLLILSITVLGYRIYIAFKILSFFMKLKYAEWLLKIERIE